ncbi:hypothetical protein KQI48_10195 [Cellulomonas hominis]|jgi:uncharacterized membrane protein YoaK (UPF0700 family)|uniref:Membrane protein n=1 Tax=Cellulomonas hominis TaxID=156981 RepID=A0A511FH41_9CELL|nr:hypothetical protein [Cellulomonas hominis]MBB5471315.1 uncharacterized membrane protein YoaK (UPF0700 family) [Cellulomonas hominis]MBU5423034.1 hypothetical protein [Cellulomonas hominis]NKY08238.1 hypothetical protein [Cellulomonas hominis]NKY10864.1 hypothetical protein [Cellulomonas hominis]GEL48502.1 membrane protein [Cellulomonas hominis]
MARGRESGWVGWIWFGALLMILTGLWGMFSGLVAVFSPATIVGWTRYGLTTVDVSTWGWVHLAVSALVFVVGVSLLTSAAGWARVAAIVLTAVMLLLQFAALPATPWWSLASIALCLAVLWALVVHGDELRPVTT